jgi:uncharacterized protein YjbI with pentapeptide repeats
MSEQSQQDTECACPHPEAVGKRWCDRISEGRQQELQTILDAWEAPEADHSDRKGPFDPTGLGNEERERRRLTGADVSWLVDYVHASFGTAYPYLGLPHITLGDPSPSAANLHLEGADLRDAHLEGASLRDAHLEGASLFSAHLEGANLNEARLEGAHLSNAHLEGANLSSAHLKGANLRAAHLEGVSLVDANLEGADLSSLDTVVLGRPAASVLADGRRVDRYRPPAPSRESRKVAHLEGADLRHATFDENSNLADVILDDTSSLLAHVIALLVHHKVWGPAALGDVLWHDVDLTRVSRWPRRRLGDERDLRLDNPPSRRHRVRTFDLGGRRHREAARAYRQVAKRLRDQGMADEADRFSYRAQVMQRAVALRQGNLLRWLFSWILFLLAGYGYRPLRSLFWYLVVIAGFAVAYFRVTHGLPVLSLPPSQLGKTFDWTEAFVLSFSAFHGRGFFNPPGNLGDSIAILATAEAVFGLFIEISFIATFTQRFFGSK